MSNEEVDALKERAQDILTEHGIELSIGGCGCCGSPWVTFKYKGETIIEHMDDCTLDNIKKDEN